MKLKVPDSVLKETTKCTHDFACLSSGQCGDPDHCAVQYANGDNVLILVSKKEISCPYRIQFGPTLLCVCPTHFALYTQR